MPGIDLHPNLAKVYQRVSSDKQRLGERLPTMVRDLSTNGAFLSGEPMPLLSRVACSFNLEGFGQIEAVGWTLWRRIEDCEVPKSDGSMFALPKGFGVLFEAIPLDARIAIHKLVAGATQGVN
jgi:hypothetical protein